MNEEILIADFAHGIEERAYASVVAVGKRFVLFRVSGHSAWNGVGHPWAYVPVRFVLIRRGQWWLGHNTEKREWEGRVARSILLQAFNDAERTGKLGAA
jgi:hypothetical protein